MTSGGAAVRISSARSSRPRKSGTSTSIVVRGLAARTAWMQSTKCCAPRGTMRMVFAWPFSFTPASRMLESVDQEACEPLADFGGRSGHAEVAGLRDGEAGIAAGVDRREGSEVHVNVEREPMVCPAPHYPYAERRHLGPLHIDSRRAGPARGTAADEVDHHLLEQAHELAHLDAAAADIDERVEHHLARTVVGDFAAAVGRDHRDAIRDAHRRGALAQRVDRWMLEQPQLIGRRLIAAASETAHRFERPQIVDAPQAPHDDVVDDGHRTITTAGWSQSSW